MTGAGFGRHVNSILLVLFFYLAPFRFLLFIHFLMGGFAFFVCCVQLHTAGHGLRLGAQVPAVGPWHLQGPLRFLGLDCYRRQPL